MCTSSKHSIAPRSQEKGARVSHCVSREASRRKDELFLVLFLWGRASTIVLFRDSTVRESKSGIKWPFCTLDDNGAFEARYLEPRTEDTSVAR